MLTTAEREEIVSWASEAGYGDGQIASGLAWADGQHPATILEAASLLMSRILYTDAQLAAGVRFEVTTLLNEAGEDSSIIDEVERVFGVKVLACLCEEGMENTCGFAKCPRQHGDDKAETC